MSPEDAAPERDAAQAYQKENWPVAVQLYRQLAEAQPDKALWWFRLGSSLRHTGQYSQALDAFGHAQMADFGSPQLLRANIAAAQVLAGQADAGLATLEELAAKGFPGYKLVEGDEGFAAVRDYPRYRAALEKMKDSAEPCRNPSRHPEYRQFDFWVGDWDVYGVSGALSGHNRVDLILGNCVIAENWTSSFGGEGKSFSKYNPNLKRWEQYWVDETGDTTFFYGQREGENLVFHSSTPVQSGPTERRLTFTPVSPDRVRQFSQMSSDGGKTWQTEYDLMYVHHGAAAEQAAPPVK